MSVLTDLIYGGSNAVAGLTEGAVNDAIAKYGADKKIAFPDTAYFLPTIYAATGVKVQTLGDLPACVGVLKSLITNEEDLGAALNAGLATAVGAEIIEALKFVASEAPYENETGIGFVPDPIIRSLGVPLVTGDIPGVAVVLGKADNAEDVANIVRDYQDKGLLTFLVGDVIDQVIDSGVRVGLDFRVIPLGHDVTAVTHVVTVAIRAALIFGAVTPGDLAGLLAYTKERVPAFVNTFGAIDNVVVSAGAGAIALGFPVIVDIDLGENQVEGALVSVCDHSQTAAKSLELRKIKVKAKAVSLPVSFAAAFEGEIIRKKDTHVDIDGSRFDCFELVQTKEAHEVEDHAIILEGPDFDEFEHGTKMNLAIIAEVAGKNIQSDFEPVFERKFHNFINCAEGIMHTGQRDMIRIRVSISAFEAGFRARHLGEILYAKIKSEYDRVVDKCQIKIYTTPEKCKELRAFANSVYDKRDERLATLTDESVDVFYTCILCQSFSPSHVCIVTPERLGLCGAVSWLDAKATNELDPTGPCQVVTKERIIDERVGAYEDVNEAVNQYSHGALEQVTLYSILEDPMTSCGCFECICGIEPFSSGFVIVNREHAGMTPLGMTFSEMASMTGGGVQTPGYMGHGKHFIASKKFLKAEGGVARIVWLPKALKDTIRTKLDQTAKELYGIDNFTDMIGDETIAEDPETLMEHLQNVGHPVLEMEPLL